ncbi:MAG: cupin domain-containing protein [Haloarculaceae archaeon]
MAVDRHGFGSVDPFEITKRPADTNGDFVRFEATVHPKLDAETSGVEPDHERFLLDNPDEHVHPYQREVIEVLAGEYAVEFEGTEHRLSEGEDITVPRNTPHRHWNPSAEPIRVAHEHHPARDSAAHAEAMWTLAQEGKTNEKGIPNPLQFAVVSRAYPGIAYTTAVPIPVQKAAFAVLGPVGRLAGYHAAYSDDG